MALDAVRGLISEPMKVIWYTWVGGVALSFCYVISSFFVAGQALSSAYGFSVVFEGLQVVAYSVGGTIVLKNAAYRSPLAIGFLIGLSFMLTLDMLVVAVLAGANLAAFPLPSAPAPAEGAVVAFSVMLFIVYLALTCMMILFKDVLVQQSPLAAEDEAAFPSRPVYDDGAYADDPASAPGATAGGYDSAVLSKTDEGAASADDVDASHGAPTVL